MYIYFQVKCIEKLTEVYIINYICTVIHFVKRAGHVFVLCIHLFVDYQVMTAYGNNGRVWWKMVLIGGEIT